MSDEHVPEIDAEEEWIEEEVDPQEVEKAMAALEELAGKFSSEIIRSYIEAASDEIESLVEWEEDAEDADDAKAA